MKLVPEQLLFIEQLLLNGLVYGTQLFIFALGLNLIFGYVKILNLAHGSFYALGAYASLYFFSIFNSLIGSSSILVSFLLALLATGLLVGFVGLLFEVSLLRHTYGKDPSLQLLLTYAASIAIDDIIKLVWGLRQYSFPLLVESLGSATLLDQRFPLYYFVMMGAIFTLALALWFIITHTTFGRTCRAIAEHPDMVSALGINERIYFALIFMFGIMLVAWGGGLIAPVIGIYPGIGLDPLVLAFAVVTIGGLGSLKGSAVGAYIVGIIRSLGVGYFPEIELAIVYLVMTVILLIRPQGLFGRKEAPW